ncbi:MAG TPA: ABC transporter ATP-binding protein [Anaerolineales bacterium]|nr:ABC transporter ATP-binding protein [Anaerolineales bacterium]
MTETLLIDASDLHKSFGDVHAVDGVTLQVSAGEIYGLVGSDGAGKTTTMRLIVGALKADSGRALVAGLDVDRQTEGARSHIGYLSQRFSLYEDLTVLENIRFFAEVRGLRAKQWRPRCMEILDFVGLAGFKDRRAGQLSGGMKQKLGLASALVTRPRVLLLDEPTTGVDPVTRQDFWQLLISLVAAPDPSAEAAGAVAVLISTPYMDEAARCHRIGFMRRGRIIAEGTPLQLRGRLADRVLELRGSPLRILRQVAGQESGVEDVRAFGDRLHLRVAANQSEDVLRRLPSAITAQGATLEELRAVPPGLEDVFIELSGQAYD